MLSKHARVWATAIVAVALAFCLLYAIAQSMPESQSQQSSESSTLGNDHASAIEIVKDPDQEEAGLGPSRSESRISSATRSELISRFHQSRSASAALAAINELYATGDDEVAFELESLLASVCRPIPLRVGLESMRWIIQAADDYCQSFAFDDERYATIVATSVHNFERERERVQEELYSVPRTATDAALWNLIKQASTWQELEAIKAAIAVSPIDFNSNLEVFDLGQDDNFIADRGRKVQIDALTLLQCEDLAAGCQAGSLRMLEQCYITALCEPSWNIQDFFANTLSPIERAQVFQVYDFLRSLRRPDRVN